MLVLGQQVQESRPYRMYLELRLWGTDRTRAVKLLTYEQGVEAFRLTDTLSDSDRETLMGGSLASIYKWTPGG